MNNTQEGKRASPWLTIKDAAEYAHRSIKTIYYWVETGKLPSYRVDDKPMLKASDIDAMYEAGKRNPISTSIRRRA
jgi:excisionase family DNA binding protein